MQPNRRRFLGAAGAAALIPAASRGAASAVSADDLERAAREPVLRLDAIREPKIIESIELYRSGGDHFVRARSRDGAEGMAVTNGRAKYLYPILKDLVVPFFLGKDARDLEALIDGAYLHQSNYKLSGLALWNCVAWTEFALLDLLGRASDQPVGALFGGVLRDEIPIYIASGNRHTTPQEEAEVLQSLVRENHLKAVKFKVGGRMSNNRDSIPGRSEALIPLAREALGDDIAIHADSNGSYDCGHGVRIGKLLEEINAHFFEEPCPFDHLEETKCVADALSIPVAGGEQETSLRRFRWMIENDAVGVVQPDLHYNGGFIRARRVANMAALKNIPITVHMSGGGTGFVDVLHFASCTPNIGAFQEYKGGIGRIGNWYDPPLRLENGAINVPKGPGFGMNPDPDFIGKAEKVF